MCKRANIYFGYTMLLFLVLNASGKLIAQGCSDAGFCTVGAMKHTADDSSLQKGRELKSTLTFIAPLGVGDYNIFVFSPGLQYDYHVSEALSLQAKINASFAGGDLGNAAGPGDVFLISSYSFPHKAGWYAKATAGVKIPLSKGNIQDSNRALPMQYQSSLGTYDIIGGVTVTNDKWAFSVATQIPVSGKNSNGYLPPVPGKDSLFAPTNLFLRKPDVLLRAGRNFTVAKKLLINAGLLGIYHIGKDEYTNHIVTNSSISIVGSEGLTLNITAGAWWQFSKHIKAGFTAGAPIIVRDIRPDGLTRKFVFSPELSWNF